MEYTIWDGAKEFSIFSRKNFDDVESDYKNVGIIKDWKVCVSPIPQCDEIQTDQKIYLDGVACLGKSTLLEKLRNEKYKVNFCEFYSFNKKIEVLNVGEESVGFHDRCSFSSPIYDMIFDRMNKINYSLKFNQWIEYFREFSEKNKWIFLVLKDLEDQYNNVVSMMIERDNGLDIQTKQYVMAQNFIFKEIAKQCPAIITVEFNSFNLGNSIVQLEGLMKSLYHNRPLFCEVKPNPNYYFDAGINLHLAEDYVLSFGKTYKMRMIEKMFIPPGMMGFMCLRSSAHKKLILSTGVLDSNYIGDFFAEVFVKTPEGYENGEDGFYEFKKGSSVVQVVLMPKATYGYNFVFPENLPCIGRGFSGFGSTDKK